MNILHEQAKFTYTRVVVSSVLMTKLIAIFFIIGVMYGFFKKSLGYRG